MRLTDDERLSERQAELLNLWLPGAVAEQDLGWETSQRAVLQVRHGSDRYVVKAGRSDDHHMGREITAHERWLTPWAAVDRAPRAVHRDREARLLVTTYLPGQLVLGTAAADDHAVFEQAGRLLALLHEQSAITDPDAETVLNERALRWLDAPHRIARATEEVLRAEVRSWPTPSTVVVPTHGDWQPRNWLVHDGQVSVIDFGRAGLRAAMSDLGRLAAQDFVRDPLLEEAFLRGYGPDPREPAAWRRTRVREAIGTAVWAHQVGDVQFETQGHRMIADVLTVSTPDML